MKLTFNGAAQVVTGSCYLLETEDKKILIDCGMFQGIKDIEKNINFNFEPSKIDAVLLTHAHIDHSGLIPKLFREGFMGKVYCTHETAELIELLLLDSAKIQEMTFEGRNMSQKKAALPLLYDTNDVYKTLSNIISISFNELVDIFNLKVKYIKAGHILGAASIIVYVEGKKIIFSGDIGRKEQSLIESYQLIEEDLDYVVMESLYGGQEHEPREESINKLAQQIEKTFRRDGNVIIPTFALHRAQEMSLIFQKLLYQNSLDENVQIFLDGPLSIAITKIYTKYLKPKSTTKFLNIDEFSNKDFAEMLKINTKLRFIYKNKDSLKLARKKQRIILAGSGMCDGGRIINHLPKSLTKKNNSIIFIGYQAEGTLGRDIVDGNKTVLINNTKVKVNAEINYLHGFSGHAGNSELLEWLENKNSNNLKKVFLTHAELDRSTPFKEQIDKKGYNSIIPSLNQTFEL